MAFSRAADDDDKEDEETGGVFSGEEPANVIDPARNVGGGSVGNGGGGVPFLEDEFVGVLSSPVTWRGGGGGKKTFWFPLLLLRLEDE